jgi:hypothetical protein
MKHLLASIFIFLVPFKTLAGEFIGELMLSPAGCQETDARACKLNGMLTYKSSRNGLVWQTSQWEDGNGESGTTDGASVPSWAQGIIGDPYDDSYLKAAIVHDHYCYEENRVRSWRDTHRMFYDALVDLGVNELKAKVMYFAVYWRGPKWVDVVPGENCGLKCIKQVLPSQMRWEGDQFGSEDFQRSLARVESIIKDNPSISTEEIERLAKNLTPGNFFFSNGRTYTPKGPDDPNINPQM